MICKLILNIENNYHFLTKVKELCWRLVTEKKHKHKYVDDKTYRRPREQILSNAL